VETSLVKRAEGADPRAVFDALPGTRQLGDIIDRVTYLGTCELLLEPHQISLLPVDMGEKTITGILLERQLESLEGSRWKMPVQAVVQRLLSDALAVYGDEDMPVRRARVLLKCLDFAYHVGPEITDSFGSPEGMGEEIKQLLQREVRFFYIV
jgi:separase